MLWFCQNKFDLQTDNEELLKTTNILYKQDYTVDHNCRFEILLARDSAAPEILDQKSEALLAPYQVPMSTVLYCTVLIASSGLPPYLQLVP